MSLGLAVVVSAFAVLILTSVIKHVNWSSKIKSLISMGLSLGVGGLTAIVEAGGIDQLSAGGVMGVVGAIYLASQGFYRFILEGSKAEDFLAKEVNGGSQAR